MAKLTLQLNSTIDAVTENPVYAFDVLVAHAGKLYGFASSGIFEITGDTAAGSEISAFMDLALTDLGIRNQKALRSVVVGYEADQPLSVTITNDEDYTKSKIIPSTAGKQRSAKVACDRDSCGRYHGVKITNTLGGYFALDALDLLFVVQPNKNGLFDNR